MHLWLYSIQLFYNVGFIVTGVYNKQIKQLFITEAVFKFSRTDILGHDFETEFLARKNGASIIHVIINNSCQELYDNRTVQSLASNIWIKHLNKRLGGVNFVSPFSSPPSRHCFILFPNTAQGWSTQPLFSPLIMTRPSRISVSFPYPTYQTDGLNIYYHRNYPDSNLKMVSLILSR